MILVCTEEFFKYVNDVFNCYDKDLIVNNTDAIISHYKSVEWHISIQLFQYYLPSLDRRQKYEHRYRAHHLTKGKGKNIDHDGLS